MIFDTGKWLIQWTPYRICPQWFDYGVYCDLNAAYQLVERTKPGSEWQWRVVEKTNAL